MWRKVHEADLNASLSLSEIDAFRKSALDGDPVEAQIRQGCAYVRGCIRTGGSKVRMAPAEDWLPESLISPAMDYLRFNILTRMNMVVNESRTKAYESAKEIFDQLRRGEFVPESDGPQDDSSDKALSPIALEATPERLLD